MNNAYTEKVLLALDCSNRWTALGLVRDGQVLDEFNADMGRVQAAELPGAVNELLERQHLTLADVGWLAVTVGPGYFTGIRIGMAYASALAFALGVNIVPLSSLEVVLRSFSEWNCGVKVPLLAASRDVAFSAVWKDGFLLCSEQERSRSEIDELLSHMSLTEKAELVAVRDVRLFANSSCENVTFTEHPGGGAAALLAWERREQEVQPDQIRARYMREPGLGRS